MILHQDDSTVLHEYEAREHVAVWSSQLTEDTSFHSEFLDAGSNPTRVALVVQCLKIIARVNTCHVREIG